MKQYTPNDNAKYTVQILFSFCYIFIIAIIRFVFFFLSEKALIIFSLILVIITFIFIKFYIPIWFKSLKYIVTDNCITINCGVFVYHEKTILIDSLQSSTLIQTPLSKYTCFHFLPLNAYGGRIIIAFLNRQDIAEICAYIFKNTCNPYSSKSP